MHTFNFHSLNTVKIAWQTAGQKDLKKKIYKAPIKDSSPWLYGPLDTAFVNSFSLTQKELEQCAFHPSNSARRERSTKSFSELHSQTWIWTQALPCQHPAMPPHRFLIHKFISHPSMNIKVPSPWAGISPFPLPMEICMILLHILIPLLVRCCTFWQSTSRNLFWLLLPTHALMPSKCQEHQGDREIAEFIPNRNLEMFTVSWQEFGTLSFTLTAKWVSGLDCPFSSWTMQQFHMVRSTSGGLNPDCSQSCWFFV